MMRSEDQVEQSYFRSSERIFRVNGAWYFAAREGDQGPFKTETTAVAEMARYINEQTELKDFQDGRKLKSVVNDQHAELFKQNLAPIPVVNEANIDNIVAIESALGAELVPTLNVPMINDCEQIELSSVESAGLDEGPRVERIEVAKVAAEKVQAMTAKVREIAARKEATELAAKKAEAKARAKRLAKRLAAQQAQKEISMAKRAANEKPQPLIAKRSIERKVVQELLLHEARAPIYAEPPLLVVTV